MLRKIIPILFLLAFCGVKADAGNNLVAITNGDLSTSQFQIALDGNPVDNHAAEGTLTINSSTKRYTNYWTPVAGDSWDGCLFYIFYLPDSQPVTSNLICELWDGASVVASSTITFVQSILSTGATTGWVWFRPTTPFVYTSVTPNNWRASLISNSGSSTLMRRSATTTALAYLAVTTRTATVALSGDNLWIVGSGTDTRTAPISSYTITINGGDDYSFGTVGASTDAITIGAGGTLAWATTGASTITLYNNLRLTATSINSWGIQAGTEESPLLQNSTHTISFAMVTTQQYGILANDQTYNSYYRNYNPPRVSIQGANTGLWRDTLSGTFQIGATSCTTSNDMLLSNGCVVALGSTDTTLDAEVLTISSTSGTTIYFTSGMLNKHSVGGYIWKMKDAGCFNITSTSSARMVNVSGLGSTAFYGTQPTFEIKDLSARYFSGCYFLGCSTNSYFTNVMQWQNVDWDYPFFVDNASITRCITFGTAYHYGGRNNGIISSTTWASSASRYMDFNYSGQTYNDCVWDGMNVRPLHTTTFTRPRIHAHDSWSIFNSNSNFGTKFIDMIEGSPVASANGVSNNVGVVVQQRYINPSFNSTTKVSTSQTDDFLSRSYLAVQSYGGNSVDSRVYKAEGIWTTCGASLDDTLTKTVGKTCLKGSPNNTHPYSFDTCFYEPAPLAVKSGDSITLQGFIRKDSSYSGVNPTVHLTSANGEINESFTMTVPFDTWEGYSLFGTVSSDTYVTAQMETNGNAGAGYFADTMLVQGNPTSGTATGFELQLWADAELRFSPLGGTVESTYLQNAVNNASSIVALSSTTVAISTRTISIQRTARDTEALILAK